MNDPRDLVQALRENFAFEGGFEKLDTKSAAAAFATAVAPRATENFQVTMAGGALTTTRSGVDGLRDGWVDFLEGFDSISIAPVSMQLGPARDCVVEFVDLRGKPKGVDAEIEQAAAAVWRVEGERLSGVEFYLDRDAALCAGGLEPDSSS